MISGCAGVCLRVKGRVRGKQGVWGLRGGGRGMLGFGVLSTIACANLFELRVQLGFAFVRHPLG
jgi:hypothetical protein